MWESFRDMAIEYLKDRQDRLTSEFELFSWPRYDYDQDAGTLSFSSNGRVGVVADIQIVGSTSKISGTWLWSWDNPSIAERVRCCMLDVREYGATHRLEKLTTPKWPADEYDAWEMTAAAAFILKAEGAYRAPHDNGAVFMVLRNVRRVVPTDSEDHT